MSDDIWRRDEPSEERSERRRPGPLEREMDVFDDDEFGGPLFEQTAEHDAAAPGDAGPDSERLSFGDDASGSLPHWTEPPTGETPNIPAASSGSDATDDLDVWSSFTSEAPAWKEGESVPSPAAGEPPRDPTGELRWEDAPAGDDEVPDAADAERTTTHDAVTPPPREPARITIGTDPSGMPRRPDPRRRGATPQRPPRSAPSAPGPDRRNLPVAVATGLVLAAVFLALVMWRPAAALAFVTVALGLASLEYFAKVTEKGYRPAIAPGVAACVAAPLAAYWQGDFTLPLVVTFAFLAAAIGFIGADSIESGPMPNMAITVLGVIWIGLLGSYAALILRWSTFGDGTPWGTDTLVLVGLGVVANDVGAYFVGSAFGRTPLRSWISPGKSVEGLLGGTVLTLMTMIIVRLGEFSDTWSSTSHLLLLGIVISIAAPLGDLTESMFKRNLDVKDFGALVRGHGGVLDRFDGFLFALPAVYYLMLVIEPWTAFSP